MADPPSATDDDAVGAASEGGGDPRSLSWRPFVLDPALVMCFAVLIGFPLVAVWTADRQPVTPVAVGGLVSGPAEGPRAGVALRDLPALTAGGTVARATRNGRTLRDGRAFRAALSRSIATLFTGRQRERLEDYLTDRSLPSAALVRGSYPAYPYRYPVLDRLLDRSVGPRPEPKEAAAANDLAALLILVGVREVGRDWGADSYPQAGRVAFALLDRARTAGGCLPQLNLAFLLASEKHPRDDDAQAEFRRARRWCPDDATPLWMLGQYRSVRSLATDEETGITRAMALVTFHRLQRELPRSPAGWAGEGDAQLRLAYEVSEERPFTARVRFRRALALYRHARTLRRDPGLAVGAARALAGLGEHAEAAALQERALRDRPGSAPLQARLVEYFERAHRFARAAQAATRFAARAEFPAGPGLFMNPQSFPPEGVEVEDASGPLSLGVERLAPVTLRAQPPTRLTSGGGRATVGGVALSDISFIPGFREVRGVTGFDRWCPDWSRRRDLVLAGRAREALAGFPKAVSDIRPELRRAPCSKVDRSDLRKLAAVAEQDAEPPASADFEDELGKGTVALFDARQNMWRFAGRLDRARAAVQVWSQVAPDHAAPVERAGEIAFLDRDYETAARLFAKAARLARSRSASWSFVEARALLKQGTALELARRYSEALRALVQSDDVASRALGGLAGRKRYADAPTIARGTYLSYNGRVQAGDTELRRRHYAAAAEQYEATRERERELERLVDEPPRRPEVLDNNQALVELQLGHARAALRAARRAVGSDPLNPLFRQTRGLVYRRLGLLERAEADYRLAVKSDPTLFPAWNDLGIALGERGRHRSAADAFRRAVGVRPGYATGWFNLGVALERSGPRRATASQGALARAVRLDPALDDREHELISDDGPYFATLDLSKPLPPRWEFAADQDDRPVPAVGAALALLLGLRLSRRLLAGSGGNAQRWLDSAVKLLARVPRLLGFTAGALAVAVTVGVFVWPLARSNQASTTSVTLLAIGVGALIVLVLRSRAIAARAAGVTLRQRSWWPSIAVGVASSALGAPWAPLPVAQPSRATPALHWIGPLVAGVAALSLVVLAAWLHVPTTTALATSALVMTASMLAPIKPLDGGHIAEGTAGDVASVALAATVVLLLLGVY